MKHVIMLCKAFFKEEASNIAFVVRYVALVAWNKRYDVLWMVRVAACFGLVIVLLNY